MQRIGPWSIGALLATLVLLFAFLPVMLLVVHVVNRSKGWYEHKPVLTEAHS